MVAQFMSDTPAQTFGQVCAAVLFKAKAQPGVKLFEQDIAKLIDDTLAHYAPAPKKKARTTSTLGRDIPPAPEAVTAYAEEIGYPMDGQAWCDHYAAKGWVVSGKTKMQDWRAAVRNWKNNGWKPVLDPIITSQRTVSRAHTTKPATPWELREREKTILGEIQKLEAEGREYRGGDQLKPGEYPGFFLKPGYETKIANAKMALRELNRELSGLDKDHS